MEETWTEVAFEGDPIETTLVIPPGRSTDLAEYHLEKGDEFPAGEAWTDAFTGDQAPQNKSWTCPQSGWYVYANGTFTKVADADD